jgi:hypothetical protein
VKEISHTISSAQFFSNNLLLNDTWPFPPKLSPFTKKKHGSVPAKKTFKVLTMKRSPKKTT